MCAAMNALQPFPKGRPRETRAVRSLYPKRGPPPGRKALNRRGSPGDVGQGPADDPLRDPRLVQELRDPAEEERPPRAEDQAGVDVRRSRNHALVEQVANLVGDRLEN